jgi:hypothetical protein
MAFLMGHCSQVSSFASRVAGAVGYAGPCFCLSLNLLDLSPPLA